MILLRVTKTKRDRQHLTTLRSKLTKPSYNFSLKIIIFNRKSSHKSVNTKAHHISLEAIHMLRQEIKFIISLLLTNTKTHKFDRKAKCEDIMGINNAKTAPAVSFGEEEKTDKK